MPSQLLLVIIDHDKRAGDALATALMPFPGTIVMAKAADNFRDGVTLINECLPDVVFLGVGDLRQPEPQQRAAGAWHGCAIFMLNPQGHISSWNASAEGIQGYSTAEIIGKHFSVLYASEDVSAGVPQRDLEVARSAGSLELEGWRLRKDGSRFRALVTIPPLHDGSGEPVGFGTMIRDVTERRSAEGARQKSHTMFERLFKLAPEAVVVDNHGLIRQVNQQAEVLFGYQREEMLGERIELLMPSRFREGHLQHRSGYFSTPTVRSMGSGVELFGLHRDGEKFLWTSC